MHSRLDDVCHHLGFAVALRRSPPKMRLLWSLLGDLDRNVQVSRVIQACLSFVERQFLVMLPITMQCLCIVTDVMVC